MIKNYLTLLFISFIINTSAQNTCLTAQPVELNNVYQYNLQSESEIPFSTCNLGNSGTMAAWYKYTPNTQHDLKISTSIEGNTGGDTRIMVYKGTCGNLVCVGADDDSGNGLLSELTISVEANTIYYIVFDNRWSSISRNFRLSYVPPTEFFTSVYNFTGSSNKAVVDMNGDYLDDVVDYGSNSLNIHKQQLDGSLALSAKSISNVVYSPGWSITAGDFDKNGYNDLMFGATSGVTLIQANTDGSEYSVKLNRSNIFSQRANFVDINNDGNLDLFVCHDVAPNVHFMNDGQNNMTFNQGSFGTRQGGNYGSIWVDYDNDGDVDLFIAKCRGGSEDLSKDELYRNDGNGIFVEVAAEIGLAEISQAWSSAWGDFDNDGDMDILIGINSNATGSHKLMLNTGNGTFVNGTSGSGWDTFNGSGQEYIAQDFNNDGYIDVMCSNGSIMYNNGNMTFTLKTYSGYDGPIGDLNNDGFLDIVNDNKILYGNPNQNNWIKLNLKGITSNSNGIGARVEIYGPFGQQIRDVRSGDGFAYMSSLNPHFGIGSATAITSVVVKWPSGTIDTIQNPSINSSLLITEGSTLSIPTQEVTQIAVYPNPTTSVLNINHDQSLIIKGIQIVDLTGKIILDKSGNLSTIDVSDLAPGTYIAIIKDSTDQTLNRKFIKL